ncbi:MAG TPA: FtsX-like permease family protein [Cytophagaceae bacterium]|jgi:lipoprotein-releasing system permease protein
MKEGKDTSPSISKDPGFSPISFIAKRIGNVQKESFSHLVSRIATSSIAVGLAVMLISFTILHGFKKTIQDKIFTFSSHLQITKYDVSNSFEESPISTRTPLYHTKGGIENIDRIQVFSQKPGLIKTENEVSGVIVKGVSTDFYLENFKGNIIAGEFINFKDTSYSKDIMLSKKISDKLNIDLKDTILIYFVQNPPRFRKLIVSGIYETGLEELDDYVILGDIRLNQKLNGWNDTLVGGYEIFLKDFNQLDTTAQSVFENMEYDMQMEKVTDKYIQIFDWLRLLNRNVIIFLILILFVACFNMISTLLIMIMERTNMIGVLKALGATNYQIRSIFVYRGIFIIAKGMIYGNLIGLGLCALQYYFNIIPLNPENYYMSHVPIEWSWLGIAAINAITFIMICFVLLVPVVIISNIKPVKAIKFD